MISSHILTELADCCTSIGIIERGQFLMHGPIESVYRQIRRNRLVEVQFISGEEAGMSILRSSPDLRSLEVEPNAVVAELETDDEGLADLIDELLKAGVRFKSFNDRDPTLEDVFMTVTKGLVT